MLRRLWATLRPAKLQRDLDDELQFHIDRRADELIAQGMSPDLAAREAAQRFGNRTLQQERARDRDIVMWLESLFQDLRYAMRTLRRNPGFAITAIFSLALGIGANAALFSIMSALVLKQLPVHDPKSLVILSQRNAKYGTGTFAYDVFDAIRRNSRLLNGVAAMSISRPAIEQDGASAPGVVEIVSGEYFDVLGVNASRGQVFHDGKTAVAVISDSFWRAHYASADAIDKTVKISGTIYTIAGIADEHFRGDSIDFPVDVWIPLDQAVPPGNVRRDPKWTWLEIIARRAPGATIPQIKAEVNALERQNLEDRASLRHFDYPQQRADFLGQWIELEPGATGLSYLRGRYFKPLVVIGAIAGMVLLIACANLANLMLARATAREREIATRKAIGAGRARLIRQLLTESALITLAGSGAAILVARWLSGTLLGFIPDASNALVNLSFQLDWRLIAFMIAVLVATCLLAGLAPAIRVSGAPRVHSASGGRALIAIEVALCTILLVGSGWFVRTLWNLRTLDAGFVRDQVLLATVGTPGIKGADAVARLEDLRTRLATIPGVRSVAFSNFSLMIGDGIANDIDAEGHQPGKNEDLSAIQLRVSPNFFETLGTPLLAGRDFTDRDAAGAPQVAIVNETFARRFFNEVNAIGKHFGENGPKSTEDFEIVAVVKDTRYASLREKQYPIYYLPARQAKLDAGAVMAVRSSGDLGMLASAVRDVVHQTDPSVTKINRFSTIIDMSLASERIVAQLSAAFGALALLVACIGIYGILAYRVARRTREIGVRIALGASRGGVQWMVVRESLALLFIGIAIGIPVALGLSRYVSSLLYGLTPADPWTMIAALGTLACVSMAAAFLPARRASKIDPMSALRAD
jgi:predicted permease